MPSNRWVQVGKKLRLITLKKVNAKDKTPFVPQENDEIHVVKPNGDIHVYQIQKGKRVKIKEYIRKCPSNHCEKLHRTQKLS